MKRVLLSSLVALLLVVSTLAGVGWSREALRVGIRPVSPPISFLAVKDGVQGVRGYTVDEVVMVGKLLGRHIDFVPVVDLDDRRSMLASGELDILAHGREEHASPLGATYIPVGVRLLNHIYVNENCTSVTCPRDLSGKRVVMISGGAYSPQVKVEDDVIKVASPLEALTMLNDGVVDVFVAPSERIADYLIDANKLRRVLKKGVVLGESPMGFLVKSERAELIKELRGAIKYLEETGKLAIIKGKWFGRPYTESWVEMYAEHIALAAALIGLVLVGIVMWNVSLKRRVTRVAADLRRTEQRYQDIIESSPDMIFLVNESGDILHANERAHTFLFFPEEADANLSELMAPVDVDEIKAFMTKVFNDGCDKHEFSMNGASGHTMEVEIAGRLIQGPLCFEILACLFARNVTERNRMEEDLIQSERLGIIGKMAASVAHEINNPLGIIQANAEVLMYEEAVSEDVKEGLSAIQRNAIRAGEITQGLLEAASPKPVSEQSLDVSTLIYDSISLLGAKGKGRQITVDVPDELLTIRVDERALQQVLVNLLFNSLDHMAEDDTVTITARKEECEEGETVRVVVSDTGSGIPREDLPRIFEPFFTSRKGGFGLGLFITRRMVERHNGLIFAESTEGKGTSMFLEFPAHSPKEH